MIITIIIAIAVGAACVAMGKSQGEGQGEWTEYPVTRCICPDAIYIKNLREWRVQRNPSCPVKHPRT